MYSCTLIFLYLYTFVPIIFGHIVQYFQEILSKVFGALLSKYFVHHFKTFSGINDPVFLNLTLNYDKKMTDDTNVFGGFLEML